MVSPKTSKNALEAVLAAFDHRETGCVPLWGAIMNRPVYEFVLGADLPDRSDGATLDQKLEMHSRVFKELGIDICRAQLWPPDKESTKKGETDWAERTLDAKSIKDFRPEFPDEAARKEWLSVARRQVAINSPHTVFAPTIHGPFCRTFEKLGFEEFCYAIADEPAEIDRLMDAYAEFNADRAQRLAACPDVSFVAICDDIAYKGKTLASPKWMREHWIGKLKTIVEPLKRAGKKVIYHSDGKMDALIPDLIGIGIDGINPIEPIAGMDLAELKRDFGNDVTLIGGVDCSQLLPFGTPGEIRDEVKWLLDIGAPGGGFIIGDSSCVLPTTPVENLLAFYETVHQYRFG